MKSTGLELVHGTLDILILQTLATGSMHGYDVARFIRQQSGDTLNVMDGALYTSLHRMEARGWVDADWGIATSGKRAKFYTLTRAGRKALRDEVSTWERYVEAVRRVLAPATEAGETA